MRPSLRHSEIESQGGLPAPKGAGIALLIAVVAILALLVWCFAD